MSESSSGEYKVSIAFRDFFYIPNLITLSRIIFIPPILFFLSQKTVTHQAIGFVLIALCFFTDWLDGFLARRLNQVSVLGKMLDPIIDKIVVTAIIIALIAYYKFPWWAVVIFVSKDIGLAFFGFFTIGKNKRAVAANFWGKVNLWMQGCTIGFYILDALFDYQITPLNYLKIIFLTLALITTFISAFSYGTIFLKASRKGENQ